MDYQGVEELLAIYCEANKEKYTNRIRKILSKVCENICEKN